MFIDAAGLICNPSLQQRLGEKARQKAQQFDASLIAQRCAELLEQLMRRCSGHGQGPPGGTLGLGVV